MGSLEVALPRPVVAALAEVDERFAAFIARHRSVLAREEHLPSYAVCDVERKRDVVSLALDVHVLNLDDVEIVSCGEENCSSH